jgi:hypothetical protein
MCVFLYADVSTIVPFFHAAGLFCFIGAVLHWDRPIVFCVDRPLSADLVLDCLNNMDVESVLLPPVILEQMIQDEKYVKVLQSLKMVWFGGGTFNLLHGHSQQTNQIPQVA